MVESKLIGISHLYISPDFIPVNEFLKIAFDDLSFGARSYDSPV